MNEKQLKYNIREFLDQKKRMKIKEKLGISESTFYRKCYARIGEKQGFEACELKTISAIIGVPESHLFTDHALFHYVKKLPETKES